MKSPQKMKRVGKVISTMVYNKFRFNASQKNHMGTNVQSIIAIILIITKACRGRLFRFGNLIPFRILYKSLVGSAERQISITKSYSPFKLSGWKRLNPPANIKADLLQILFREPDSRTYIRKNEGRQIRTFLIYILESRDTWFIWIPAVT